MKSPTKRPSKVNTLGRLAETHTMFRNPGRQKSGGRGGRVDNESREAKTRRKNLGEPKETKTNSETVLPNDEHVNRGDWGNAKSAFFSRFGGFGNGYVDGFCRMRNDAKLPKTTFQRRWSSEVSCTRLKSRIVWDKERVARAVLWLWYDTLRCDTCI